MSRVKKTAGLPAKHLGRLLLTVVLVFVLLPVLTTASNATDLTGLYALEVVTGATGGEMVSAFRIDYIDEDNQQRSYFINALSDLSAVYPNTDIMSGTVSDGDFYRKVQIASNILGFPLNNIYKNGAGISTARLGKNSTDTYLVRLPKSVKAVENIAVYMTRGENSRRTQWECQSLRFLQVTKTPVKQMYGFYSNKSVLDLGAKPLAALDSARTFDLNSDYSVYNIAARGTQFYTGSEDAPLLETETVVVSQPLGETFIFRIDLADVRGAGIEAFTNSAVSAKKIRQMALPECLYLTVTYADVEGGVRSVSLPVVNSVLGYAITQGGVSPDACLSDYAGMGSTLAFQGVLPRFFKLIGMQLDFSDKGTVLFDSAEFGYSTHQQNLLNAMRANDEVVAIAGVSLYIADSNKSTLSFEVENDTTLVPVITGTPYLYYSALDEQGDRLSLGGTLHLNMKEYTQGAALLPGRTGEDQYLITLETDKVSMASTAAQLQMSISFTNTYGNPVTATVDMQEAAAAFYGSWPTGSGSGMAVMDTANPQALLRKNASGYPLGMFFLSKLSSDDLLTVRKQFMRSRDKLGFTAMEIEEAYIALGGIPTGYYEGEPEDIVGSEYEPEPYLTTVKNEQALRAFFQSLLDRGYSFGQIAQDYYQQESVNGIWVRQGDVVVVLRRMYAEATGGTTPFTIPKSSQPAQMEKAWGSLSGLTVLDWLRQALNDDQILSMVQCLMDIPSDRLQALYFYGFVSASPDIVNGYTPFFGGMAAELFLQSLNVYYIDPNQSGGQPAVGSSGMAYYYGMSSGKSLTLLVNLPMLQSLDSITFTNKDNNRKDDWQLGSIVIRRLDAQHDMSKRTARWETVTNNGITSNRTYYRDISRCELVREYKKTVLIGADEVVTIALDGSGVPTAGAAEGSYITSDTKKLTYAQTQINYGFAKTRFQYQVTVTVEGKSGGSADLDDYGSANYYYFQLVFTNGKSGYVLANQQLLGDSFRTGSNCVFYIGTNEDFGQLTSVNIIPDDTAENSDVYDKLNINKIEVKSMVGGSSTVWNIKNVGWIGIDYRDDAEGTDSSGKLAGRPASKLVKNYKVTSMDKTTEVQFQINTYEKYGSLQPDGVEKQFDGSVKAEIEYITTKGALRKEQFDLVQSMSSYYGLDIPGAGSGVNTRYMARAGHTDRFTASLVDLSSIKSISIQAKQVNGSQCYWNISSISFGLVESEGSRIININEEYDTNATVRMIAYSVNPLVQLDTYTQTEAYANFVFAENRVAPVEDDDEEIIPPSRKDMLNLYVKLADGAVANEMSAAVRFVDHFGITKESARELTAIDGGFSTTGLGAANMTIIKQVTLTSRDQPEIEYMDIQRERDGVVLETYRIYFDGVSYNKNHQATSSDVRILAPHKQVVSVMASAPTSQYQVGIKDHNVFVALEYTTPYSPGTTYRTEFTALFDSAVHMDQYGTLVDMEFALPAGVEITRVIFMGKGVDNLHISDVLIRDYEVVTEKDAQGNTVVTKKLSRSYSNTETVVVFNDDIWGYTPVGESDLTELTLTFTTADAQPNAESGPNQAIFMALRYVDSAGATQNAYFSDLRNYLVEGDFLTGSTGTVRLLVRDVSQLLKVAIYPDTAWYLERLEINYESSSGYQRITRQVNRWFATFSENNSIHLCDIGFVITANGTVFRQDQTSGSNAVPVIVLPSTGGEITFTHSFNLYDNQIDAGVGYIYYTIDDITDPGIPVPKLTGSKQNTFTHTFAANTSTSPKRYRVTWYASENSALTYSIDVILEGYAPPANTGG